MPEQMSFFTTVPEPVPAQAAAVIESPAPLPVAQVTANLHDAMSIEELLPSYGLHVRALKESTQLNFLEDISLFETFLKNRSGHKVPIGKVGKREIHSFIDSYRSGEIIREGNRKDSGFVIQGRRAEKTVARKVSAVKHFFRWLKKIGVLDTDPTETFVYKRPEAPLPEILTAEEMDAYFAAARQLTPLHQVITYLLLGGGLKMGELLELDESHVRIEGDLPIVQVKFTDCEKRHQVRSVPLPIEFADTYREHISQIPHAGRPRRLCTYKVRKLEMMIKDIAVKAGIAKTTIGSDGKKTETGKRVSSQILRDSFAVRHLYSLGETKKVFGTLGLSYSDNGEAIQKYHALRRKYYGDLA